MKKSIIIIGLNNFSLEIKSYLNSFLNNSNEWEFKGYLDSLESNNIVKRNKKSYRILGYWNSYKFKDSDFVILAILNGLYREKVFYSLKHNVNFYTYISPETIIGKDVEIGEGSIICPNCIFPSNIKLGNSVIVNVGTNIGNGSIIEDFSSIMSNVTISWCCHLERNVYIGSNSVIIQNCIIKSNSTVGAGSVIIRNIDSNITVFGNPPEIISKLK